MAREKFTEAGFKPETLAIIERANQIIAEYQAQGFTLTLRQLYYQFVARDLIKNLQSEYSRLGSIINKGRLAGLIDWSAIEDRTRNLKSLSAWESPEAIVGAVAEQYREDVWAEQPNRVEVWIEKDALVGVIEGVCEELRVPFFACRGYTSQSEQYAAGKRFAGYWRRKQRPVVLHLGDHDPSGIDMTRDNRDRLTMFARHGVEVKRLALNFNQVEQYDPPPNPAKETDSRHAGYQANFGDECWELDALDPPVIVDLIRKAIGELTDEDKMAQALDEEGDRRGLLELAASRWESVADFLGRGQ